MDDNRRILRNDQVSSAIGRGAQEGADEMTKSTLSLDQTEWRVLLASNIQRVTEYLGQNGSIDVIALKALHDHFDRAKALATAWHNSSPAPVAEPKKLDVPEGPIFDAPAPKKRRGRPPKAQVQAMQ
jgi:hypothetical protein